MVGVDGGRVGVGTCIRYSWARVEGRVGMGKGGEGIGVGTNIKGKVRVRWV